jgi:hypothetical protein
MREMPGFIRMFINYRVGVGLRKPNAFRQKNVEPIAWHQNGTRGMILN